MATAPERAPLKPLDEALAQLLAAVEPGGHSESVATLEADGRVLAQDVVSQLQVPAHDNSAMDGYAVHHEDVLAGLPLEVSQRIAAGSVGQPLQRPGAARIFTGAPIPEGADAVVMQEDCVLTERLAPGALEKVQVNAAVLPGQWIRRAGEDVTRGAVVLPRGTRLGPAQLGLAASIGMASLTVVPRPRVALFSTGNELVLPGTLPPSAMRPGTIYNSNRFFLHSLLRRLGCEVSDLGIVPDQRVATLEALRSAAQNHDLILSSGGVSVGEEDHVRPAVQALGQLALWQLAIKPGKPFAYGRVAQAHFIGLPGNPVASFVTFLLLVRPFLLRMQGAENTVCPVQELPAHFDMPHADKRREFLRVRRNAQGGLDLFANQSSAVLTSAVWGDGLIDNPPNQAIHYGDTVRYLAFADLLS